MTSFIASGICVNKMMTNSESKMPNYGGQALIEGVLMRGKKYVVAAMRKPDDNIQVEYEKLQGLNSTRFIRTPFLRGLVVLWDSLAVGMKYLTISANVQSGDDEKIEGPALFLTLAFSVALAIGLFFVLPTILSELVSRWLDLSPFLVNLVEGIFRLAILVLYIWAIGFSKEISRVFAYHGAEHKTINTFENGKEIVFANVSEFPLAHPRCGTSFLLTLVIFSIVTFSLLGPLPFLLRLLSRILFVPFLAMFAYELIRFMGNHIDNPIIRIFTSPNMILQNLTTREPDEKMIEVAIVSFNKLLQLESSVE